MQAQQNFIMIVLSAIALAGCALNAPTQSDANRPSLKAARLALSEGESSTALGIARGVLADHPANVAALVAAGDADAALGNRRTAEGEYRHALALQSGYTAARLGLGKLKLHDNVRAAEREFRNVLAGEPGNAAALTDLGVSLDLQEHHKEAQTAYTAALAANPELTSARVDLGLSLALNGDPTQAEQMLRDATESGSVPPKIRADFAVAEVMAGHSDLAAQTLEADLSSDEAHASVAGMEMLRRSSH